MSDSPDVDWMDQTFKLWIGCICLKQRERRTVWARLLENTLLGDDEHE